MGSGTYCAILRFGAGIIGELDSEGGGDSRKKSWNDLLRSIGRSGDVGTTGSGGIGISITRLVGLFAVR